MGGVCENSPLNPSHSLFCGMLGSGGAFHCFDDLREKAEAEMAGPREALNILGDEGADLEGTVYGLADKQDLTVGAEILREFCSSARRTGAATANRRDLGLFGGQTTALGSCRPKYSNNFLL